MSTQWSGWPCVSTTAVRSSTATCSCRCPNVPLPQSTQIDVSPRAQEVAAARAAARRRRTTPSTPARSTPRSANAMLDGCRPRDRGTAPRACGTYRPVPLVRKTCLGSRAALRRQHALAASSRSRTANAVSSALDTSTTSLPIDVADRTGEQGVVRATEHQRVDVGRAHRRQQPLGEHVDLVRVDVARLDELHEAGARGARELDASSSLLAGEPLVRRPTRSCRRCRSRRPGRCGVTLDRRRAGPARSRRSPGSSSGPRSASSAAAAALLHATTSAFTSRSSSTSVISSAYVEHLVARLRPVREPAGVAEVDDVLVGQQVDERAQHREATEAGVEDADRPRHAHVPRPRRAARREAVRDRGAEPGARRAPPRARRRARCASAARNMR